MTTIGNSPSNLTLTWVAVQHMTVAEGYQRDLNEKHATKIAENWDWLACGALPVSMRTAREYHVIDGQHRVAAAKQLGIDSLPCVVYTGLSRATEARLFVHFNRDAVRATSADVFRADVQQGDEAAVFLNTLITRLGWRVGSGTTQYAAVSATRRVYDRFGPEVTAAILSTIKTAWPDAPKAPATVLDALAGVVAYYGYEAIDWDTLRSALRSTTPLDLAVTVKRMQSPTSAYSTRMGSRMAMVITELYNKACGRATHRRLTIPASVNVFGNALHSHGNAGSAPAGRASAHARTRKGNKAA